MNELQGLRFFYRLKGVYRSNSVNNRRESSAEHSWSCLILADYFLSLFGKKYNIDKLKVFEMLLYHDIVEIEAGDTPLTPTHTITKSQQEEKEMLALKKLEQKLPEHLKSKVIKLFLEFSKCETIEAKFANAIDKLDAIIHELDYKKDWNGWTEEFLRRNKEAYFESFPELKSFFEKLVSYLKENNYF